MISARDMLDVSARRIVHKLRRHPGMIARAFNAGRSHVMRDRLMDRARKMRQIGIEDSAVGEVVAAARFCNRVVIWFLRSLEPANTTRRKGSDAQ